MDTECQPLSMVHLPSNMYNVIHSVSISRLTLLFQEVFTTLHEDRSTSILKPMQIIMNALNRFWYPLGKSLSLAMFFKERKILLLLSHSLIEINLPFI